MPPDLTANQYRQRAAEMRSLADKTPEPAFRRSCEEVAEGWEALARQHETLDGLQTRDQARESAAGAMSTRR